MAQTLSQRLDDINKKIDKAETSQSYGHGENKLTRGDLEQLYKERDRIETKIETHGSSFIPGQNTTPKKAFAHVVFR